MTVLFILIKVNVCNGFLRIRCHRYVKKYLLTIEKLKIISDKLYFKLKYYKVMNSRKL